MKTYEITNNELLDYLRNEIESDRRKEIAAELYNDKELRDRFQAIQRIEALILENYNFPTVNVSSEIERKISAYISEMVAIILAEKEKKTLSAITYADEKEKAEVKKFKIVRIIKSASWAAAVIIIFSFFVSLVSTDNENSFSDIKSADSNISVTSEFPKPFTDDTPLIRYPIKDVVNFDEIDDEEKKAEDLVTNENVLKDSPSEFTTIPIEKFEKSDFIKKFRGNTEPVIVRKSGLKGDINKDGVVNALDIQMLEDMIINSSDYSQDADCDEDNKITIKDLNLLKRKVISETTELHD